jgi:DNA-directed RNA polymerase subunit RPC12/RpoP
MKQGTLSGFELVAVGQASILKAQSRVTACATCSNSASQPFEDVLGEVLGGDDGTAFMLTVPIECPRCGSRLFEATKVSTGNLDKSLHVSVEETDVVFVDKETLAEAEDFLAACEHCDPARAEISFDQVLDSLTGCDPTVTEYVICHAARCPHCRHEVMEKTLIVPR